MSDIFTLNKSSRTLRDQHRLNLKVHNPNQTTFGTTRSMRSLGPKVWNLLPVHLKSAENLETFRRLIKNWDGVSCKCNICRTIS